MLIPPGGGPPPRRHASEEMFHVLEGSLEVTLRDRRATAGTGDIANSPPTRRTASTTPATYRHGCSASSPPPAASSSSRKFGDLVASRTSTPPQLTQDERERRIRRAAEAAPRYGIEML